MAKRLISIALSLAFLLSSVFFCTDVSTARADSAEQYVTFYLNGPDETLNADTFEVSVRAHVPEGLPGGGVGGMMVVLSYTSRYFTTSIDDITVNSDLGSAENNIAFVPEGLRFIYENINTALTGGDYVLFTVKFSVADITPKNEEYNFHVNVPELFDNTVQMNDIYAMTDLADLNVYVGERFEVFPNEPHIYVGQAIELYTNKPINDVQNLNEDIISYESSGNANPNEGVVTGLKPGRGMLFFTAKTGETTFVTVIVDKDSAQLSSISVSNAQLTPEFKSDIYQYSAIIPYEDERLDFEVKTEDPNAFVYIDNPTLSPGETGEVVITVTSGNAAKQHKYTISVTRRSQPGDCNLKSLSIENAVLSPDFSPNTLNYTTTVPYIVEQLNINALPVAAGASVDISQPPLEAGKTVQVVITVTAPDGVTQQQYTIDVSREAPSDNCDLRSLSFLEGMLAEEFSPDRTQYTATVPYTVEEIHIQAKAANSNAKVAISCPPLVAGTSVVAKITVTAQDGTSQKIYTISVTRSAPSDNARLSSLSISSATLSPVFSTGIYNYTATVPYTVDEVTVNYTTEDDTATAVLNNPALAAGETTDITVTVTAQDGTTKRTYTISVTREAASTNANLESLTVSGVTLSPSFSPEIDDYTATVPYTVNKVTVNYTTEDNTATAVLNNPVLVAGQATDITVTVTAQDGATKRTYTISVTREAASTNANLKSLTVSNATISPAFSPNTLKYTASVAYAVDKLNLTAAAADSNATVQINNPTLSVGGTTNVTVTVTAQDGTTRKVYTITVTRAKPPYPDRITSSRYTVGSTYISKISAGTTVATLLSGINERQYVKVYRANGSVAGNNDVVGTGFTVRLMHGNIVKQTLTVVVTGDVNGDSSIDITDFLQIKAVLLKKNSFSNAAKQAADINGDNVVDITDFLQVKSHLLKKTTIRPR